LKYGIECLCTHVPVAVVLRDIDDGGMSGGGSGMIGSLSFSAAVGF
jgi:hypothetical protein